MEQMENKLKNLASKDDVKDTFKEQATEQKQLMDRTNAKYQAEASDRLRVQNEAAVQHQRFFEQGVVQHLMGMPRMEGGKARTDLGGQVHFQSPKIVEVPPSPEQEEEEEPEPEPAAQEEPKEYVAALMKKEKKKRESTQQRAIREAAEITKGIQGKRGGQEEEEEAVAPPPEAAAQPPPPKGSTARPSLLGKIGVMSPGLEKAISEAERLTNEAYEAVTPAKKGSLRSKLEGSAKKVKRAALAAKTKFGSPGPVAAMYEAQRLDSRAADLMAEAEAQALLQKAQKVGPSPEAAARSLQKDFENEDEQTEAARKPPIGMAKQTGTQNSSLPVRANLRKPPKKRRNP